MDSPSPEPEQSGDRGPPGRPRGVWRHVRRILPWLAALGMLGYAAWLCYSRQLDWKAALRLPVLSIALIVALQLLYNLAMSCRHYLMLRALGLRGATFGAWFRIFVMGRTMNSLMGQSGNVYRALALKKGYGFGYSKTIAAYSATAWMSIMLNAFLIAAITAVFQPGFEIGGVNVPVAAGAAFVVTLALPFLARRFGRLVSATLGKRWDWVSRVVHRADGAVAVASRPGLVLTINAVGVFSFAVNALMIYIAFRGMGIDLAFPALLVFVGILRLSSLVIITPGNLGVRELAYGFLSSAVGVGLAEGLLVSGILRLAGYLVLALLGTVVAVTRDKEAGKDAHLDSGQGDS